LSKIAVYFSDCFDIDADTIEEYGAVNISLINDLPLFIDPFLLFNSDNLDYQAIHSEMIKYLKFLQIQSQITPILSSGMRESWFCFSEVLSLFGRFLIEIIESYRRIIKFIQKKNDVNL
jgi:hypothetical protein